MSEFLELGPGTKPHPAATSSLDKMSGGFDVGSMHWPHRDQTQDVVYSSHLLEHIPKGKDIIHVFNEACRVLKPGGRFFNILPLVGYGDRIVHSYEAWADPTHVQMWWMPQSVQYFSGELMPDAEYGIHEGWKPLGPRIEDPFLTTETTVLNHPLARSNYDTFWGVRNGWEGIFSLVKA